MGEKEEEEPRGGGGPKGRCDAWGQNTANAQLGDMRVGEKGGGVPLNAL